jgi:hypothetical protein
MSLLLEGTNLRFKSVPPCMRPRVEDGPIEVHFNNTGQWVADIEWEDFVGLVKYVMTNTHLEAYDDPRIGLVWWMRNLRAGHDHRDRPIFVAPGDPRWGEGVDCDRSWGVP